MAIDNNPKNFNVLGSMGYNKNNVPSFQNPNMKVTLQGQTNTNMTSVEAQNLIFKVNQEGINLGVKVPHFEADFYDRTPNDPLEFKNFTSFDLNMKNGIVELSDKEITQTAKTVIQKKTPLLKDIKIDFLPGNNVNADIKVKKFVNLRLELGGTLNANPVNNTLYYTPEKITLNKIPIKKIMDFFGLELGEIVKLGSPSGSYFTAGKSIYFTPTEFVDNPKIDGHITAIKTGNGSLAAMIGNDNVDTYQPKPVFDSNNYLTLRGGDVNFNGFNLKETELALLDGTPENLFDIMDDPSKKVITKGQVSIPEAFIDTALKNKAGDGSSLKNMRFTMPNGQGKLQASMWGFLPISLNLNFGKSDGNILKVSPDKGRLLGFIPLPNSLLVKTLKKETEGQVEGNGVTVDKLADLKTAPLKEVRNENGQLVLVM